MPGCGGAGIEAAIARISWCCVGGWAIRRGGDGEGMGLGGERRGEEGSV